MEQKSDGTPKPGIRPRLRLGLSTPGLRGHRKENNKGTETPRATKTLPLKSRSNSCRRPGLGLPRKELTKKRLEFVKAEQNMAQETQKDAEPSSTSKDSRTIELEKDIEIWRTGFAASMDDLQASIEPRQSKKSLLIQLGISLDMLSYLEED
ncbi:uncharacterized protein Dwil_GK13132 [Drosophila willistoni]|uniref:Uncharacterized protein n=1 Tax=Drosophila willistoni TaxID=7260 RepID=B4NGV3_DROWI|nr:uncharacterized protein LOC6650896 [Drosophila willistoni]EDW84450.1 uncharacterized protein Dwil_GK13132 [Drosophila willistoni]